MVQPLLRLRRGQLDLLRPAVRSERGAVGEADAARLPVQRQGLCAPHRAPPRRGPAARAARRDAAGGREGRMRAAGSTMPSSPPRPATGRSRRSARRCSRSPTRASSAMSCSRWRRGSAMAVRRSTISRRLPERLPGHHRRRRVSRRLVAAGSHRRGAALPGRARAHLCLGGRAAHPGQRVERPRADVAGRRDPAPRAQRAGLHEAAPRAGADGGREVRVSLRFDARSRRSSPAAAGSTGRRAASTSS